MERSQLSSRFHIGSMLPDFTLPDVENKRVHSLGYFADAKAALVLFTCNHCPYVKGSEDALNKVISEFQPSGLKVIAISSNDAAQYPEDSFEKMKEKALNFNLSYPYVYDETQEVARQFDAACTPECYLFDSNLKLAFHGTVNDSPRDASKATRSYLSDAIQQVLAGKKASPDFFHPIGCSIKWKESQIR